MIYGRWLDCFLTDCKVEAEHFDSSISWGSFFFDSSFVLDLDLFAFSRSIFEHRFVYVCCVVADLRLGTMALHCHHHQFKGSLSILARTSPLRATLRRSIKKKLLTVLQKEDSTTRGQ